tara:strand:+ start:1315 stop:2175 length:861 start_codon:yes stop_codon:yes gene_type:complete
MKNFIYFLQFVFIIFFFLIFKIFKLRISSAIGGKLFQFIGPIFRSKDLIFKNIKKALPNLNNKEIKKISSQMWNSYGRIFAEYMFLKNLRNNLNKSNIVVDGQEILDQIKKSNTPVVFISGHFSNFELMAMQIEKSGIKLAAIYRPLNNKFLNIVMERIRKKYICNIQIKKGITGLRDIIKLYKKNYSTALMIDQRVSEGIKIKFFNHDASTTTIPAQLFKKFKMPIVPIFIERFEKIKFKITIRKPLYFSDDDTTESITKNLNKILEKMILKKPEQWIWSHNRWK